MSGVMLPLPHDQPQEEEYHSSICLLICQHLVKVTEEVTVEKKIKDMTPGRQPDEAGAQERNLSSQLRVKQEDEASSPLDEYFCKGMDTSGPAAWAAMLQDMTEGSLPDVGQLNAREGVREEKCVALDLRTTKFPPTQTSSVRRATLIQNFEADFIRAIGDH